MTYSAFLKQNTKNFHTLFLQVEFCEQNRTSWLASRGFVHALFFLGSYWILFFQRFRWLVGQKTLSKILYCACQVCNTVLWVFVCFVGFFLIMLEIIFFKINIKHLSFSVLPCWIYFLSSSVHMETFSVCILQQWYCLLHLRRLLWSLISTTF